MKTKKVETTREGRKRNVPASDDPANTEEDCEAPKASSLAVLRLSTVCLASAISAAVAITNHNSQSRDSDEMLLACMKLQLRLQAET